MAEQPGEIWRRVLGFYTQQEAERMPGAQLQHIAVLTECQHEVPVAHGQVPAHLRCLDCEAGKAPNV